MSGLNMIVCFKQVPDPEAPASALKVEGKEVITSPDIKPVVGEYGEFALEVALKIKGSIGGKITALSLGNNLARDVVKKSLAVGADELILLEDEAFEGSDNHATSHALAAAIRKIGEYDLIFCGRQSSDWGVGQVGLSLATQLGIPAVSVVRKVDIVEGKARVEEVTPDGYNIIDVELPALFTITSEAGALRYAALKGIMAAARRQPTIWKAADLGLDPSEIGTRGRVNKINKLYQPSSEVKCEIVEADTPAEAGAGLAEKLREARIL
jgi:electron transfer flavoprotein beta subunit